MILAAATQTFMRASVQGGLHDSQRSDAAIKSALLGSIGFCVTVLGINISLHQSHQRISTHMRIKWRSEKGICCHSVLPSKVL
jgi:hypothetical protein